MGSPWETGDNHVFGGRPVDPIRFSYLRERDRDPPTPSKSSRYSVVRPGKIRAGEFMGGTRRKETCVSETVGKARVWLLALVAAALVIDGSA